MCLFGAGRYCSEGASFGYYSPKEKNPFRLNLVSGLSLVKIPHKGSAFEGWQSLPEMTLAVPVIHWPPQDSILLMPLSSPPSQLLCQPCRLFVNQSEVTAFRVPHPKEERGVPATLPLLTPVWLCYHRICFSSPCQPSGNFSRPSLPNVLRAGNLSISAGWILTWIQALFLFDTFLNLWCWEIESPSQTWVNVLISKPDVELHVVPRWHQSSTSYPYITVLTQPVRGRSPVSPPGEYGENLGDWLSLCSLQLI